jgi:hypothetical protein
MTRVCLAVVGCALFAAGGPAGEKYVKVVHVDTGKVLAVADDSEESGARAVLAKDSDAETRQWKVEKDGEYLKLVNRKSGKVLDVYEESRDEGAQIIIWDDKAEGNDNQRWQWAGDGKERRLRSKHSELVLDVDADGQVVQKKADGKNKKQLWKVVEVEKK